MSHYRVLNDSTGSHGFVYAGSTFTTLDCPGGAGGTRAQGINAAGQVVGQYYDSIGSRGFVYTKGTYTALDDPAATPGGTLAQGINAAGQVVGQYSDITNNTYGFVYTNGAYTTLNDPAAIRGTYTSGINSAGWVVGYYNNGKNSLTGNHGFITAPTPEPSQFAALALGTLGLSALALRARKRRA